MKIMTRKRTSQRGNNYYTDNGVTLFVFFSQSRWKLVFLNFQECGLGGECMYVYPCKWVEQHDWSDVVEYIYVSISGSFPRRK